MEHIKRVLKFIYENFRTIAGMVVVTCALACITEVWETTHSAPEPVQVVKDDDLPDVLYLPSLPYEQEVPVMYEQHPAPYITIATTRKVVEFRSIAFERPQSVHKRHPDYNKKRYAMQTIKPESKETLRKMVYSSELDLEPVIQKHSGGSALSDIQLLADITAIVDDLPNVPHTREVVDLVYETIVVETNLGRVPYTYAAEKWHNYGLCQFREDTASYLLSWLDKVRPDAKAAVMKYYDDELSFKDNLLTNVPFSIAMTAQYYWHRLDDLQANIATVEDRAKVWKSFYNGPGAGTVNVYLDRVEEHYEKYNSGNELVIAIVE